MRVKIWGARGSIPTPMRPEEIREKIISAILNISRAANDEFRDELMSAILDNPQTYHTSTSQPDAIENDDDMPRPLDIQEVEEKRRDIVQSYVDRLPPLVAGAAGGNTPCVEVQVDRDLFIIDAGSGIRELGLELMKGDCGRGRGIIHLFFSHPHWDHIQGFPFFRPAFVPGNKIFVYGVHDMEAVLRRQQEFINFPVSLDYMQADFTFVKLKSEDVLEFGDLRIRNICNHHPGDSYAFRFEKGNKVFVYASDASYPAGTDLRPFINFFSEADLLIYDSQFTQRESDEKEDWGHSSSFAGVEMGQQAKVKCLALFHHDPTCSDADLEKILEDTLKFQQNQYPAQEPIKIIAAQEGQTFDLTPHHTTQIQQVPGGKAIILKPAGIFDEQVAAELREQLLSLEKSHWPPELIIDMSAVDMLQVAGLKVLVKLKKELKGTSLALTGPSISVQQLIELAGYLDFFPIYPSVYSALNAFQARETLNLPGQMIKNRYYIEAKIGDGHLGTVFKATDTRLNRPVAIKILSPTFSEGAIEQFLNQAHQITDLNHPNIVSVYDCDEDRGLSFMVEEIVEGRTLLDAIEEYQDQLFPLNMALRITEGVAQALEYAHAHGVIHGDLKPKNILLANEVMISDFGLGRLESGKSFRGDLSSSWATARYLAPEQILGHPIDARTDLYALGVILYELFTGQPPFEGSDEEVLRYHRNSLPRSPRELNPKLSRSLEHLILKLLDKDPNQRYATARQVRRILASMTLTTSGETEYRSLPRQRWPALIGRTQAIQRLLELWSETRSGRGQLVFITGEPGFGKTRLTQELTDTIGEATLLVGNCGKQEGSPAYQPFVEALRTYFAGIPDHLLLTNPVKQVLDEINQFIPETERFVSLDLASPSASGVAIVSSSSVSLAKVIKQATTERPWLLILDNLHWADRSTLQLLHYLARHCRDMSLMVVGTYRISDVEGNRFLTEILHSLREQAPYTTISLDRLSESQVKDLLESIWSQAVPGDLVTAVHHRTGGNPFYVAEVARGLVDEGVVSWRDDRWYFGPIVEAGLPQRTRDAILRRVNRLSKEVQSLLHRAAILGRSFEFDDLYQMSGLSGKDMLDSLDVVMERQLIQGMPGDDALRFSHTEIQEVLYESLSPLKCRLLHREAGEAMEQRYLPDPERIAATLAYHFFQAGELEKGLIYSIQAANQAVMIYANQDALIWYTQALDALDQLSMDNITQQQRFELLLAREKIYDYLGERQMQGGDLAAAQMLAQILDDPAKQAVVHNRYARYERITNHFNDAATEAQAGLIAARQANNSVLEAESVLQLGHVALSQGQLETARERMHTSQELLAKANNRSSEARSLNGLGTVYRYLGQYEQAESYYHQALAMNQMIGDRYGQAASLQNLGLIYIQAGEYTSARSYLQQALEINRAIGDRRGEAICLTGLASLYKELGDYSTAQELTKAAMTIRHAIQDQQGQVKSLCTLSAIYLALGNYTAAYEHATQALEKIRHLNIFYHEGRCQLELGLALETLGDLSKASDAYNRAQMTLNEAGRKAGLLDARAGLARCLLAVGKTDSAREEIESCLTRLKTRGIQGVNYPIRFYLTAYWVLQATNSSDEAGQALHDGYTLLQKRARAIDDTELRSRYLEDVPENKELAIQFEKYHQAHEAAD